MGLLLPSAGLLVLVLAGGVAGVPAAGQAPRPGDVFTPAQATAGESQYQTKCASCHAPDLGGRDDAPALKGEAFMATWGGQTTKDLHDFISSTMPPDGGELTAEEYLAVVAYVLQQNGGRPGTMPLTAATAVSVDAVVKPQ
jgi:mono/diheme cytochrome c family protein